MKADYLTLKNVAILMGISLAQWVASPLIAQNCDIAHYTFNGTLNNSASSSLNGIAVGAQFATDRCGRSDSAMLFNETDSVVVIADDPALDFTNAMTVSAWINFGFASNTNPRIISKWAGPFNQSSYELFTTQLAHGYRNVVFATSDGVGLKQVQSVQSLEPLAWHHVSATFQNGNLKIYINGSLDNSTSFSAYNLNASTSDLTFGQKNGSSGVDYFFGKMDDVMLYDCALTANQIDSIFNAQYAECTVIDSVTIQDTVTLYDTVVVVDSITVEDTLYINVSLVGVPAPNNINTIKVYPNPARKHLIIDNGNYSEMDGYKIYIKDAQGKNVFHAEMNAPLFNPDLNFWSGAGSYFLTITDPDGLVVDQRVIVLY